MFYFISSVNSKAQSEQPVPTLRVLAGLRAAWEPQYGRKRSSLPWGRVH